MFGMRCGRIASLCTSFTDAANSVRRCVLRIIGIANPVRIHARRRQAAIGLEVERLVEETSRHWQRSTRGPVREIRIASSAVELPCLVAELIVVDILLRGI